MQVALVLYPGFTVLDIIGPFQVLKGGPGHDVVFLAGDAGPVMDYTGLCPLVASATFDEVTAPDVVVVPGELFAPWDGRVVEWLRRVHPTTTWTTSVCTGALYLGAAGILDGMDATTHWARREQLEALGARYTEQRVVERGKVITAAGMSSGIAMGLTLMARMHGDEVGATHPARHRVRPATALRHRLAVQGARRDGPARQPDAATPAEAVSGAR